jgi:hypothetical protein
MGISERKLNANRANSKKGGQALKDKIAAEYEASPSYCAHCKDKLPQNKRRNKFCGSSCSAAHNNSKRVIKPRHNNSKRVKPRPKCKYCGKATRTLQNKYCSQKCSSDDRRVDDEYKKAMNRAHQAAYRAKHGYVRAYAPDANKETIKEMYANCPEGYEVDHIVPLSKGGLHHEDNLQYLTVSENRQKGNKLP